MPTECELNAIIAPTTTSVTDIKDNNNIQATNATAQKKLRQESQQQPLQQTAIIFTTNNQNSNIMENDMSTSQTSSNSTSNGSSHTSKKTAIISPDPTAYVTKARVTRPTPPPPPYNPMQFVQIKPCNLYQTAQEQLKKAEEVKKIKEIRKEEPEDWQNNLDNWKSSRRKRVEHIIDRVVEVKKLELEEHDRTRRKSKTFFEMIEGRGERAGRGLNKLASLAVYNEDESNDLSDLGIGTSSASGKSSLSDDYDNNGVMSDNVKVIREQNNKQRTNSTTRQYISSPGYETSSSSTAPASSPDPYEYTYEGAIQDYKQRVSRAASGLTSLTLNKLSGNTSNKNVKNGNTNGTMTSKDSTPERLMSNGNSGNGGYKESYPPRRGNKIEDRLMGFEVQSPSEEYVEQKKVDVPKIDISKRKEIFENNQQQQQQQLFKNSNSSNNEPKSTADTGNGENEKGNGTTNCVSVPRIALKDRFKRQNSSETANPKETCRLSGDITSIKERLQSLEQQQHKTGSCTNGSMKMSTLVDIPSVPPLKERVSSLQSAATKEEIRKPPVKLVDARQLEIMKSEEEKAKQLLKDMQNEKVPTLDTTNEALIRPRINCIKSEDIQILGETSVKEPDNQMHATIEALALEEKQLAEAASVVNQIEAEFEELNLNTLPLAPLATSSLNVTSSSPTASNINETMEYSVSSTNQDFSYNRSNNINSNDSNNVNICHGYGNTSLLSDEVKGISALKSPNALKSSAKLQRRSTNEMIHAKNLLKMFKETFPNDIELDGNVNLADTNDKILHTSQSPPIESRIFENSQTVRNFTSSPLNFSGLGEEKLTTKPPKCPIIRPCSPICQTVRLPASLEYFSPPKITGTSSPLVHYSPPPERSANSSPFSINGRVEIFNSKYMSSASPKPLSPTPIPTMTTNKSKASQITDIKKNAIEFPKREEEEEKEKEEEKEQQHLKLWTKPVTALQTVTEAIPSVVNKETRNNPNEIKSKPMKTHTAANEPNKKCHQPTNKILRNEQQQKLTQQQQQQEQKQQQHQQEIVTCAPTVTVLNPEELPKPNTVKKLSSCFQHQQPQQHQQQQLNTTTTVNVQGSKIIPQTSPKPLPRTSLTVKCPSKLIVTNNQMPIAEKPLKVETLEEKGKTLSLISSSSSSSTNSSGVCSVIEVNKPKPNDLRSSSSSDSTVILDHTTVTTQAQVHIKEKEDEMSNFASGNHNHKEKQNENELLTSKVTKNTEDVEPADMPPLLICTPNESSLYKLAASSPQSPRKQLNNNPPISPTANAERDVALCSGLLSSLAISPSKTYLQRQQTIEEEPFEKIISQGNRPPRSTGYSEVNHINLQNTQITSNKAKRQVSVQEEPCTKVDVVSLPVGKQEPSTKCISVSPTEIKKNDHFFSSVGGPLKPLSKPNSPIMAARAAHSKALIETCEKIIAEEKLASSQLKSTLPISPRSTPILGKKSKLPKPLIVCCKPIESMSEADVKPIERPMPTNKNIPLQETDDNVVIARMHVVETQIKVTTSTPPSSPKCKIKSLQASSPPSQRSPKKTKNIFDFLKRNFGVGPSHASNENLNMNTDTAPALSNAKEIGLTNENIQQMPEEIVKYDEIHNIENSKFYLTSDDAKPPPLPRTPAPVNIEIKKCFITDEIVEDGKTELDLTREINELLDEELNKLNNQKEFANEQNTTKSCT